MNISMRAQEFELTAAIDAFARESLVSALERFDHDIVAIDVYLKDTNGPKGGIDKQVLICVRLRNRQLVAINTSHDDLYAAIRKGVHRTKRAVRRNLRRSRRIRKQRLRDLLDAEPLPAVPRA